MASVKTSGLIGDKFIALSPGAEEAFLKPGERITLTESAVDLEFADRQDGLRIR